MPQASFAKTHVGKTGPVFQSRLEPASRAIARICRIASPLLTPDAAVSSEPNPEEPGVEARSAEPAAVAPSAPSSPTEPVDAVGPRTHAVFWFAIGCAMLGVAQLPLAFGSDGGSGARTSPSPSASAPASSSAVVAVAASGSSSATQATSAAPPPPLVALIDPDAPPPPFRVAQLASDPTLEVAQAKVGKHTCETALLALGVLRRDLPRLEAAIRPVRRLSPCHAGDRIAVALARSDKTLRAFELETAPGDFVLVHERRLAIPEPAADAGAPSVDPAGNPADLVAARFVLPTTHRRHATAFVIGTDLPAALAAAGLDPSILESIDDALDSRSDLGALQKGAAVRLVADATYVLGRFDRYDELVALEIRAHDGAPPVRLYHVHEGKGGGGWFDAKGHQPLRGNWRMPVAFARVTSRFNPRRLHPVLHVIMPHNGCDFAASPGTPVYSIGPGLVTFTGSAGPSGNLVQVMHAGGIESGYAHLSRFAPGVSAGTKVEAHTLVGYSGTTGRSTGPHLHLSVKRHGVFVDPLSLRLDGVRVVPPAERAQFAARKADADAALDAVGAPKPSDALGTGAGGIPASPASSIEDGTPEDD